jgi:hypothetical protein
MSRKYYKVIAEAFFWARPWQGNYYEKMQWNLCVASVCTALAKANPSFQSGKFWDACGGQFSLTPQERDEMKRDERFVTVTNLREIDRQTEKENQVRRLDIGTQVRIGRKLLRVIRIHLREHKIEAVTLSDGRVYNLENGFLKLRKPKEAPAHGNAHGGCYPLGRAGVQR